MDSTQSVNLSRLRTLRSIVALFDCITVLMDVPYGTLNRLKGWNIVEPRTLDSTVYGEMRPLGIVSLEVC